MKVIKTLFVTALILSFAGVSYGAGAMKTPLVKRRQVHQQKRIIQGVKSGQLTLREFYKLEKEQRKIQKEKKRFASDGVITRKERAKLHRDLNRASKHIFIQKHDRQRRR